MLFLPQGANIQWNYNLKQNPIKKINKKISLPTMNIKPPKTYSKDQNQWKELKITLEMFMESKILETSWVLMLKH